MDSVCVIGYGIVGKATAKGLGIEKYIDVVDSTINLNDAAKCRFIFVCLPTPTVGGVCDTTLIEGYAKQLVILGFSGTFIIRSTVIPGTARKIMERTGVKIVSNPEFLTESSWEKEAVNPGLIVIGADDPQDGDAVRAVYEGRWRGIQIFQTDTITAETVKYALNCFFAVKVVYVNAIYDFCQNSGANYETVRKVLEFHPWGSKNHLSIWHKGGRGAGGKCLSKDLEAFARESGNNVLMTILAENNRLLTDFPKTEK